MPPEVQNLPDPAPDVELAVFPTDHGECSRTGGIGTPRTATAETGEEALERFADQLVKAIDEFRPLRIGVRRRAVEDRV